MKVIGMISGTSYDAVDVAAAEFTRTGDVLWLDPLGDLELLYPDGVRDAIAGVLPPAPSSAERICQLTTRLGKVFAETAVKGVGLAGGDADLVVSHGQTVYHWVADGHARGTLQLGEPAWIAERTGLPVLSNLRSADIARGGHGAPLAPTLDALLLPPASTPGAALNLGGIANLTVIRPDGSLLGYDVGPANALIDAAGTELAGVPYDAGGAIARSGRVLPDLLDALLAEPYYAAPPPKSTGKELFSWPYLRRHLEQLTSPPSAPDVLATVTELTARVVATDADRYGVTDLVASGGGTRNPYLMERLGTLGEGRWRVRTVDELGIGSAAKEAYLMALIGYLSWHGLPGAMPAATGATTPAVLGSLTPGGGPLRLPEPSATPPGQLRIGRP